VRREHFDGVQRALLWVLRDSLGEFFTRETHDAWSWFYQCLSDVICNGLESAPADEGRNSLMYGMSAKSPSQTATFGRPRLLCVASPPPASATAFAVATASSPSSARPLLPPMDVKSSSAAVFEGRVVLGVKTKSRNVF
jgi:hypothetical protein